MAMGTEKISSRDKEISDLPEEFFVNRTGIMLNPGMGAELLQGAKGTVPSSEGDGDELRLERAEYVEEALPLGSKPSVVGGMMDAGQDEAPSPDDNRRAVLLDKLGERLAFERQGTRLYEAFMQKVETLASDDPNGPDIENLRHICAEELEHFKLLQEAIVELGGDATVQSPSADVAGVLSHGALQIVSDPRTTVAQGLQALLTAELVDNDGWEMLQNLAEQLGNADLAEECGSALEEEREHLESVRTWASNLTLSEAVGADGLIDEEEQ
jgi:rubrerythrin